MTLATMILYGYAQGERFGQRQLAGLALAEAGAAPTFRRRRPAGL